MDDMIISSKKRLFLAFYLDYIFLSIVLGYFSIFVLNVKEVPIYVNLVILLIFESVITQKFESPGMKLLSISKRRISRMNDNGKICLKRTNIVDPIIYNNENWLTILIGVFFILEGSKRCIRWAMWTPPPPFLGIQTDDLSFPLISIAMGVICIYAGYFYLKLSKYGFWLAVSILLTDTFSIILSWNQWDEICKQLIINRRAYQGLPVTEESIQFMQSIIPEATIGFSIVVLLLLLFSFKKLKNKKNYPSGEKR
ncbi:MAG: hypothetical protein U9Q37_00925 [Euryarchaeota archaeon]|nr:hypothetical protein [Euryarchaeota archaeon]